MQNFTQKELLVMQDQLTLEKSTKKFLDFAAGQCTDAGAKNLCQRIAADHQKSYHNLVSHLGGGQNQ